MNHQRTTHPRLVLGVLFAGAFVMGCAEMLVVGLVDLVAADLDVSVPAAGALVTANALGLAVGGPLLTAATARVDRRRVLLVATAVFVAANLLPALGSGHTAFLGARVVIGAVQGLFIAAAMTTATSVVPPERAGRAMATVITGFATASAVGLPLGTLLGQALGWRVSFLVVDLAAGAVLVTAALVLPSVPADRGPGVWRLARYALAPRVLVVLTLAAVVFAATQSTLTYLVPFLDEVAGVDGAAVGGYLLAYGVATTAGSWVGGRLADRAASRSLVACAVGVTLALGLLQAAGSSAVVAAVAVLAMGLALMGSAPSLQHRVDELSGPGAALAASLPASAVNLGIAAGSFAGGLTYDSAGVHAVALTGVALGVVAVAVALLAARQRPPTPSPTNTQPELAVRSR